MKGPRAALAAVASAPAIGRAVADQELLRRVYQETGAAARPENPSWLELLPLLLQRWISRLAPRLGSLFESLGLGGPWLTAAAWVILAVLLILLALVVTRRVARRRVAPPAPASSSPGAAPRAADVPAPSGLLRDEIEARLARGDARGALEALWWWLARALCGAEARAWWTTRDLVERVGRPGLLPVMRRFDRAAYGRVEPTPSDVRGLLAELEGLAR